MSCDPDMDETPQLPCYWGWRNTIWGDRCQHNPFPMKDGKDPNIRCMGGGPKCLVKPKYKDFKNSVSKTSAECYSGFMHGAGKKDPICRRLLKPTKYSNTQCFGPKGKDGKRPTSCDLTNTLTDEQIDLFAVEICKDFHNQDFKHLTASEKYIKLMENHKKNFQLTTGDEIKLMAKIQNTCFEEIPFTPEEAVIFNTAIQLPEKEQAKAFEEIQKTNPQILEKVEKATAVTGVISRFTDFVKNNKKTSAAVAGVTALTGLLAADLLQAGGVPGDTQTAKILNKGIESVRGAIDSVQNSREYVTEKYKMFSEKASNLAEGFAGVQKTFGNVGSVLSAPFRGFGFIVEKTGEAASGIYNAANWIAGKLSGSNGKAADADSDAGADKDAVVGADKDAHAPVSEVDKTSGPSSAAGQSALAGAIKGTKPTEGD